MKTTAHRGLSSLAPENTMAAFELAAKYGAEWIEIDVQLSQEKSACGYS
ncbi:glycerophosphoryl diester phosphodiesterase [Vibrio variabilis]|uniref:Glycerophosphoryl diester phosphodiesterase n=1 Tax=Vibrio variabilis TaxID=990271 RepID=A0ABQ0JD40_9VIBR|nr:glycerophosphoryl diester phosphodiesterase [Vibrio variabilis]